MSIVRSGCILLAATATALSVAGVAHAGVPNPNCALRVPAAPLSAAGLATPYELSATDGGAGPCNESTAVQSSFVEAAVLDPATGSLGIYHPLVVDRGTTPAVPPVPVVLPPNAVVGIWFGSNADTLTLRGPGAERCVNGTEDSIFGQFAYCNARNFFQAAHAAINAGTLKVPALGTAKDGLPCPTTRDFSVVDQDQSDNVATTYRVIGGKVAQDTAVTQAMPGSRFVNGSDERLLARFVDPALGCTPWQAPDLTNPGTSTAALALNELSATVNQGAPAALVPVNDPMTQVNGHPSVRKTDRYRSGVDQPLVPAGQTAAAYCTDIRTLGAARLVKDAALLAASPSPDPALNLQMFLSGRQTASLDLLGCNVKPKHHHKHHDVNDEGDGD